MDYLALPQCVCGALSEWSPFEVEGEHRVVFEKTWKCNLCGRPGCYVKNDGGNAFIIPRADTEIFPPEVRNYVKQVRDIFSRNEAQLELLRQHYEKHRYHEICRRHHVNASANLRRYGEKTRMDILAETARIVLEDGWEKPYGFSPYPLPPFNPEARVYILASGALSGLNPAENYWYVIMQKK